MLTQEKRRRLDELLRDAIDLEADPRCRALLAQAREIVADTPAADTIVVHFSPSTQPEPVIATLDMPEAGR